MTPRMWSAWTLAVSLTWFMATTGTWAQTAIESPRAKRDVNIITAPQGPAIIQTDKGTIIIGTIQGINPEDYRAIAEELGVTHTALNSFFRIIEQQKVPLAELDHTLRTIATSFKQLQEQLQRFTSEDPVVQSLRQQAQQALEVGKLSEAETLLRQAQLQDLEAIEQQQEALKDRKRSAAATSAELGALKHTELAYAAAAAYYQQAAELVSPEDSGTQAEYLNRAGLNWHYAGQYAHAQPPLISALALREQVLGPEHPDVAQSLNNLAALYRVQGPTAKRSPTTSEPWQFTKGC